MLIYHLTLHKGRRKSRDLFNLQRRNNHHILLLTVDTLPHQFPLQGLLTHRTGRPASLQLMDILTLLDHLRPSLDLHPHQLPVRADFRQHPQLIFHLPVADTHQWIRDQRLVSQHRNQAVVDLDLDQHQDLVPRLDQHLDLLLDRDQHLEHQELDLIPVLDQMEVRYKTPYHSKFQ